mmetsp:Transcript_4838/g.11832  ORF Transcript_4838/g.11832 Transcript_4838/m.11832 type:complete len:382 (-) Transcript_4838:739-1884(-)
MLVHLPAAVQQLHERLPARDEECARGRVVDGIRLDASKQRHVQGGGVFLPPLHPLLPVRPLLLQDVRPHDLPKHRHGQILHVVVGVGLLLDRQEIRVRPRPLHPALGSELPLGALDLVLEPPDDLRTRQANIRVGRRLHHIRDRVLGPYHRGQPGGGREGLEPLAQLDHVAEQGLPPPRRVPPAPVPDDAVRRLLPVRPRVHVVPVVLDDLPEPGGQLVDDRGDHPLFEGCYTLGDLLGLSLSHCPFSPRQILPIQQLQILSVLEIPHSLEFLLPIVVLLEQMLVLSLRRRSLHCLAVDGHDVPPPRLFPQHPPLVQCDLLHLLMERTTFVVILFDLLDHAFPPALHARNAQSQLMTCEPHLQRRQMGGECEGAIAEAFHG